MSLVVLLLKNKGQKIFKEITWIELMAHVILESNLRRRLCIFGTTCFRAFWCLILSVQLFPGMKIFVINIVDSFLLAGDRGNVFLMAKLKLSTICGNIWSSGSFEIMFPEENRFSFFYFLWAAWFMRINSMLLSQKVSTSMSWSGSLPSSGHHDCP